MKTGEGASGGCEPKGGIAVSLPVVESAARKVKRSRASRWRAAVLVAVHVLMVAHVVQWYVQGETVSPIEPSESMYTLARGEVNAGFVFFCIALLATFIFGRFFCGWACHVVALQDLCTNLMTKIGVRPKPWRTRLLVIVPTILALYMFVWDTFKREAIGPLLKWIEIAPPFWLAPPPPRPTFHAAFMVTDFWATFPPWYVAIPFFGICGFLIVYLLGSKGFCTYGCPYGGFFAPLDKVSIGRIEVTDACNGCGHCTAACDSNVRVHQEVRDFGRVMDQGCMKCLDCVSVCPNDALKFSFGKPSILTSARTAEAKRGEIHKPHYDLTIPQEIMIGVWGWILFCGYRGLLETWGPMLMAIGAAACGSFLTWKLIQLVREPNVRIQNIQLRIRGRVTVAGWLSALCAAGFVGVGLWGAVRDVNMVIGEYHDTRITVSQARLFAPDYVPDETDVRHADAATRAYQRAGAIADGGIGWKHGPDTPARLAYLSMVKGDLDGAERWMRRSMEYKEANEDLAMSLTEVLSRKGADRKEIDSTAREIVTRHPRMHRLRMALAISTLEQGDVQGAVQSVRDILADSTTPLPAIYLEAAGVLASVNQVDDAIGALQAGQRVHPGVAALHVGEAQLKFRAGKHDQAIQAMERALACEPSNPMMMRSFAGLLNAAANATGNAQWRAKAAELDKRAAEIQSGSDQGR